ncbi:hypothetical protein NL676_006127 [Syzygium grande]|nr:hypothetical protein NL676_006127 [Syzygium grande]
MAVLETESMAAAGWRLMESISKAVVHLGGSRFHVLLMSPRNNSSSLSPVASADCLHAALVVLDSCHCNHRLHHHQYHRHQFRSLAFSSNVNLYMFLYHNHRRSHVIPVKFDLDLVKGLRQS